MSLSEQSSIEENLSEDHLYYLRSVLGIENVMLGPSASQPQALLRPSAAQVVFIVSCKASEFPLSGEQLGLVRKIVQAMKRPDGDVAILELREDQLPQDSAQNLNFASIQMSLAFGPAASKLSGQSGVKLGEWVTWQGRPMLMTHSVSELMSTPDLKKATWAHVQEIMARLGTS